MTEAGLWQGRMAITGLGLVTPVGLSAPAACAALRAGISRIGDLPGLEIPNAEGALEPVTGGQVPLVAEGAQGAGRLVQLALPALREALADARVPLGVPRSVFIGTAVPFAADRLLEHGPHLVQALRMAASSERYAAEVRLIEEGRAAALTALREAARWLDATQNGVAVVGGVDSWIGRRALLHLRRKGRLREGARASGMLPGEASAFLIVEREEMARNRGARLLALITRAVGRRDETPFGEPTSAQGLAEALREAAAGLSRPLGLIVSDLNGERSRAHEWMLASTRAFAACEDPLLHWHPAASIGDSGAASGAVGMAWAATALAKHYARIPEILVWGMSDEGAREAAVLAAAGG